MSTPAVGMGALAPVSGEAKDERPAGVLHTVLRSPRGFLAAGFLLVVVLACALAGVLAPDRPLAQHLGSINQLPSGQHLLGTDQLGRDLLSRLLYGGRSSLLGVAEAVGVLLAIAVPCGVAAGYFGGVVDRVVTRTADVMMSVPVIIIMLAILSIFGRSMWAAMVSFGVLGAAGVTRVVRSSALATREELYVAAAEIIGLSRARVVVRHVLPRARGVIVVQTSLFAALALGVQTGLTYLGLGPPPPAPTWGGMVAEAASNIYSDGWMLVPSGAVIALTVLAFGILGDVLRDTLADTKVGAPRRPPTRRPVPPAPAESLDTSLLLTVAGLTVAVATDSGPLVVAQNLDLRLAAGEAVGVVGESGCGKTMTAKAIPGLLPRNAAVVSGQVVFDGRDLTAGGPRAYAAVRGHGIGFVSQEPMRALDPTFRVGTLLAEVVAAVDGTSRKDAKARALALLDEVQIPDPGAVARRYPHELSGGMAQRVSIAIALAGRPKLLIADEPTTALDVTVQADILDLLRTLRRETGMALLMVSHDLGVVAELCSRVVVMYAGQVVEEAPTDKLFEHPEHPYTQALLAANPQRARRGAGVPTIPGTVPSPRDWPVSCHFAGRCPLVVPECTTAPVPLVERRTSSGSARCIRLAVTADLQSASR